MKPNLIPGIYNFCDRWCERCVFTNRCAIYKKPENIDQPEDELWKDLEQKFQEKLQMIRGKATELSIGEDHREQELNEIDQAELRLRKQAELHPVYQLSLQYLKEGQKWRTHDAMADTLVDQLSEQLTLGIVTKAFAKQQARMIEASLEIIDWYLHFIHVKLNRALTGKLKGVDSEPGYFFLSDANGCAKVALIGIDSSIKAWSDLFKLLPRYQDDILTHLSLLQKLQQEINHEFPEAINFMRPGFDDAVA
ncbi:MAG TPA: hypothetical protein VD884_13475 [Ohtaekwangia sp.]|nr:hypothetical protein [Ohtaekwangia sp.]